MVRHGFVRVAAAAPNLRVADCDFNAQRIIQLIHRAATESVDLIVFPELSLSGYTCADLFHQFALQKAALDALKLITREIHGFPGLTIVGLPLAIDDQLFNCAALLHRGKILGIVPKSFIPNYKEFYEGRWFAPAASARSRQVNLQGQSVPFGTDHLFDAADVEGLVVGIEICEDLWVPVPPSSYQAVRGATVLVNLSASNEVIGKAVYRRDLVVNQSGRCIAAYVYASCGVGESTTDVVFGGHCLIAENGSLLAESERFKRDETLLIADVDLDQLRVDRMRTNSFGDAHLYGTAEREIKRVSFSLGSSAFGFGSSPRPGRRDLRRPVEAHPFVPRQGDQLRERCDEIFHTQVAGLAKRLEHIGIPAVAIGVSGGLDSTLSLLVTCKTMDALGVDRSHIRGYTMPGFGTSRRTLNNAMELMRHLSVSQGHVDIRSLCLEEMKALEHRPFGIEITGLNVEQLSAQLQRLPADSHDLVFENVQARMRTNILMNAGFVIGTSDLSELALGWTTYNGDHMSMYNPNVSIPKTLVKFLVRWAAENEFDGDAQDPVRRGGDRDIT